MSNSAYYSKVFHSHEILWPRRSLVHWELGESARLCVILMFLFTSSGGRQKSGHTRQVPEDILQTLGNTTNGGKREAASTPDLRFQICFNKRVGQVSLCIFAGHDESSGRLTDRGDWSPRCSTKPFSHTPGPLECLSSVSAITVRLLIQFKNRNC